MAAPTIGDKRGRARAIEWLCEEASVVPIGQPVLRGIVHAATALTEPHRLAAMSHLATARGENRRLIDREMIAFLSSSLKGVDKGSGETLGELQAIVEQFDKHRSGEELHPWRKLGALFPKSPEPTKTYWWQD